MSPKSRPKPRELPPGYDPDFPYFIRQHELIVQLAEQAASERSRAARRELRRTRARRRLGLLRPTRRVAAMATVLSLIAASAGAVVLGRGHSGTPQSTSPAPVASGSLGGEHWTLLAWHRAGELCIELLAGQAEQSSCALAPTGSQVNALTLQSPVNDYVFGVTAATMQHANVRLHGHHLAVPTSPATTTGHAAGLPTSVRWFVSGEGR
jgi:hypothetical protein